MSTELLDTFNGLAIVIKVITFVSLTLFLVGCAATSQQYSIPKADNYWQGKPRTVGIAMTKVPPRDMYIYGANCLMCVVAAKSANSLLSRHIERLGDENLPSIKDKIADVLKEHKVDVRILDEVFSSKGLPENKSNLENACNFDYSSYKKPHNLTHLLIIEVNKLGITRGYFAHFPVTDPRTIFSTNIYLVDLETNTFDFYYPIELEKSTHHIWNEPPMYPALTNSYYQVLEEGKVKIIDAIKATKLNNL
ncbi:MAG: hypothetical protein ACI9QV_000965 [Methylophagaceae bacterium]